MFKIKACSQYPSKDHEIPSVSDRPVQLFKLRFTLK